MKEKVVGQIVRGDSMTQEPNNIVSGYARGYYTLIQFIENVSVPQIVIRINAKEGSYTPAKPVQQFLAELKAENKQVLAANYIDSRLEVVIRRPALLKNIADAVTPILDKMWDYVKQNGFVTCCGICGKEDVSSSLCSVSGNVQFICEECGAQNEQLLNNAQTQEQNRPVNIIAGIVGALLGAVIGIVLWVIIYQMGYIASIVGFIMMICSFKGFELLGGRLNIPGIIICVVIDFVAVYFAHNIALAVAISQEFDTFSFSDAYRYIPMLLKDSDVAAEYYRDLCMGYGLTALAIIPSVINHVKSRKAQYEFKKL